jgi:flagellin-like protein
MSEKKSATWTERRLRYRRRLQKGKAVSPVVATLILILIAVAAAAALYLWLVGWQGNVTKAIGTPTIPQNDTFTLGGSTTVYPLSQLAIQWFEQNTTNVKIYDQQGGSVAGVEAWCQGKLDVAAASASFQTTQLVGDGCSTAQADAAVQTVVAVDGIVGIVSSKNTGIGTGVSQVIAGNISFNATTMYALYVAASDKAPVTNTGTFPGEGAATTYTFPKGLCGAAAPAGWTLQKTASHSTASYANCPALGSALSLPWSNVPFPAGCNATLFYNTSGKVHNATGCTWPLANSNAITTYERADSSGTSQGFTQKYLEIPKDASSNSCLTDNQPVSCNLVATHAESGNPAVAAAVAADANGLGYNSFGQATAEGSALVVAGYQGLSSVGQSQQSTPILPSVGGVLGAYKGTVAASAAYQPWRVLEYVTDGVPAPGTLMANYISFVLGSEVNQDLGTATGYISLYAA